MSTLMLQTPTQAQLNSSSFQPIQLTSLDTKDPWVHPYVSIVFHIYSDKSILGVLFYISFYELNYLKSTKANTDFFLQWVQCSTSFIWMETN